MKCYNYKKKPLFSGSSFEQPPTWTTMAQNENVAVVTLLPNSPEFQNVQKDFIQSTGKTYTIVKVLYFERNTYHCELFLFLQMNIWRSKPISNLLALFSNITQLNHVFLLSPP